MHDKYCGISEHIHLEGDADVLLDNEVGGNPAWGRKDDNFDSSDALSDQVLRIIETEKRVAVDLVYRPCWGKGN